MTSGLQKRQQQQKNHLIFSDTILARKNVQFCHMQHNRTDIDSIKHAKPIKLINHIEDVEMNNFFLQKIHGCLKFT